MSLRLKVEPRDSTIIDKKEITIDSKIKNLSKIINFNNSNNLNIEQNTFNDCSPFHTLNLEKYSTNNKQSKKFNKRMNQVNTIATQFQEENKPSSNNQNNNFEENFKNFNFNENEYDENFAEEKNKDLGKINSNLNNDSIEIIQGEDCLNVEFTKKSSYNKDAILIEYPPNFINNEKSENQINSNINIHFNMDLSQNFQVKVPKLLNTISNLYDMNSERVKKRSQQMKKIKEKFENQENIPTNLITNNYINREIIRDNDSLILESSTLANNNNSIIYTVTDPCLDNKNNLNNNLQTNVSSGSLIITMNNYTNPGEANYQELNYNLNNYNEVSAHIASNNSKNFIYNKNLISNKKYQEELDNCFNPSNRESLDEKTTLPSLMTKYSNFNSDKDKEKGLFSGTSNTDAEVTDNNTNNDQAAEIVISDLECDLEDMDNMLGNYDSFNSKKPNTICYTSNNNATKNSSINTNFNNNSAFLVNMQNNNKSFVTINNNLKEKNTINNKEKVTPSYMMALFQYEDSDSSGGYISKTSPSQTCGIEGGFFDSNNYSSKYYKKNKNNYKVDNIIEEETSENNTDIDLSGKKKGSFYKSKLNTNEKMNMNNKSKENFIENSHSTSNSFIKNNLNNTSYNNNNNNSNYSPYSLQKNNSSSTNNSNHVSYNINISVNGNPTNQNMSSNINKNFMSNSLLGKRQSKSDNFKKEVYDAFSEKTDNKIIFPQHHKTSLSELGNNIKFYLKNAADNIHDKYKNNQGERLEKIKKRKNYLLKTFSKSNSFHDFDNIYNLSKNSISNDLSLRENKQNFKISFNISPRGTVGMINSKKLTPSSLSREKFYDEFFEDQGGNDVNNEEVVKNLTRLLDKNINAPNKTSRDYYSNDLKKHSYKKMIICPRHTLSQEKEREKDKDYNNQKEKKFVSKKNKVAKKKRNNNSHHNFNSNININLNNISNANSIIEYPAENTQSLRNEMEVDYNNNYKNNPNKCDNDDTIDKYLLNQFDYERLNLNCLISSDSEEINNESYIKENEMQKNLSFIDIEDQEIDTDVIIISENNKQKDSLEDKNKMFSVISNKNIIIRNKDENYDVPNNKSKPDINLADYAGLNEVQENKGLHYRNNSDYNFCNDENEKLNYFNSLDENDKNELNNSNKNNQSIKEVNTSIIEDQVNLNSLDQNMFPFNQGSMKNNEVEFSNKCYYNNSNIYDGELFNNIENNSKNDYLANERESIKNHSLESNNIANFYFSDKKENNANRSKLDKTINRVILENLHFNIDNFSPYKDDSKVNYIGSSRDKYMLDSENFDKISNKLCLVDEEANLTDKISYLNINRNCLNQRETGIDKANIISPVIKPATNLNLVDKNNIFESQDLRISSNNDRHIIQNLMGQNSPSSPEKKDKNFMQYSNTDNYDYQQYNDRSQRNCERDNFNLMNAHNDDNTHITYSEKSKNTCLNYNDIFKHIDEPSNKQNSFLTANINQLNLQHSTNSIGSFINIANRQSNNNKSNYLNKLNISNCLVKINERIMNNKNSLDIHNPLLFEQSSTNLKNINSLLNAEADENIMNNNVNKNSDIIHKNKKRSGKSLYNINSENLKLLVFKTNINENNDTNNGMHSYETINQSECLDDNQRENMTSNDQTSNLNHQQKLYLKIGDINQIRDSEHINIDIPNLSSPFIPERQRNFTAENVDTSKNIAIQNTNTIDFGNKNTKFQNNSNTQQQQNLKADNFPISKNLDCDSNKNNNQRKSKTISKIKHSKKQGNNFNAFNSQELINSSKKKPIAKNAIKFKSIEGINSTNENFKKNIIIEFENVKSQRKYNSSNHSRAEIERSNTLSPKINNYFGSDKVDKKSKTFCKNKLKENLNSNLNHNSERKSSLTETYNIDDKLIKLEDDSSSQVNQNEKNSNLQISSPVNLEISGSQKM